MNPANHKMFKVVLDDTIRADQIFKILMGDGGATQENYRGQYVECEESRCVTKGMYDRHFR